MSRILFFLYSSYIFSLILASNQDHQCTRSCSQHKTPKKCLHHFFVASSVVTPYLDDSSSDKCAANSTSFLSINGKSPGPTIQICLGDTIEVLVYNKLPTDELAFHWHGIRQKDLNYMDGVPMITQCPILPFSAYRYKIYPESAGTYFYHAHSVSQQADGVYGSLIVHGPSDRHDPSLERIFIFSSRSSTPLTWHSSHFTSMIPPPPPPRQLLVNGQATDIILRVESGLGYLLRLINANAHDCPILLSIHGHSLRILTSDGNPVESIIGTHVILFPGERLDGILIAEQTTGKYALDIQGLRDCRHLRHEAYIFYHDATMDIETIKTATIDIFDQRNLEIAENGHHCHRISNNVICSLDLKNERQLQLGKEEADETIYVPFDTNTFSFFTDEMTDNSYNFYKTIYYPAYLSMPRGTVKIPQINGMSFKYPPSPILSQSDSKLERSICSLDKRSDECADTPLFCECLQMIKVPPRKIIDVILIDQGFGGNVSRTFHLHGYNVSVIGRDSFKRPITKDEIISLNRDKKIIRNLVNPVQKDTFVVPNKGYVILRFYTDNLGYWLWEARNTAICPQLSGAGMQFLMRVGLHQNLQPVPIDFPTCGNNKGIDLLFETS